MRKIRYQRACRIAQNRSLAYKIVARSSRGVTRTPVKSGSDPANDAAESNGHPRLFNDRSYEI